MSALRWKGFAAIATIAVLCSGAAACAESDLLGPEADQGIEGTVMVGPTCPVEREDGACADQPYQTWIDIRRVGGDEVVRLRSGEDGVFRVGLRPGTYMLSPEGGMPFPVGTPEVVEVVAGVFTEVTLTLDTGIRE